NTRGRDMEDVVAAAGGRVPTSICCEFRGIETEAVLYIHLLADGSASCALATETSQGRVHGIALPQQLDDATAADEPRAAGNQHCSLSAHGCSLTYLRRPHKAHTILGAVGASNLHQIERLAARSCPARQARVGREHFRRAPYRCGSAPETGSCHAGHLLARADEVIE